MRTSQLRWGSRPSILLPESLRFVLLGVAVILILNWIFRFPDEVTNLGGAAMWGYARDGHYYLGLRGTYVEVSKAIWDLSWLHCAVLILSWPVMMVLVITRAFVPLRIQRMLSPVSKWFDGT